MAEQIYLAITAAIPILKSRRAAERQDQKHGG
jgi:hypothetical protein